MKKIILNSFTLLVILYRWQNIFNYCDTECDSAKEIELFACKLA